MGRRPRPCITFIVVRNCGRLTSALLGLALFTNQSRATTFLVRLKSDRSLHPLMRKMVQLKAMASFSARVNARVTMHATSFNQVHTVVVSGEKSEVLEQLKNDSTVESFEEDRPIYLASDSQAPDFGAQPANSPYLNVLGLNDSDVTPNQPAFSPASYTKTYVHDSSDPDDDGPLLVAVVDTGLNINHPFIRPFLSTNSGEISGNGRDDDHNGVIDDVNGANVHFTDSKHTAIELGGDVSDVQIHGTHVAGLVKTVRDQALALGYKTAQRIQILPVRFFYTCGSSICADNSLAIAALDYAISRGAKVINMSWGSTGPCNDASLCPALYQTLADIYEQDVVLVAAAGNSTADTDQDPFFPAVFSAGIPGMISVNSITTWHNGPLKITLSSFSNYGSNTVDIAAPGATVYTSSGLWSANANYPATSDSKFITLSGTSMASPLVAGIAAVVRTIRGSLNAYDVKNIIMNNAVTPTDEDGVRILAGKNRAEGYANAADTFNAAKSANSSGALPATNVSLASVSEDSGSRTGGCGLVANATFPSDDNPFGGNSLGLFTAGFFLVQLLRRMSYKFKRC